MMKATVKLMPQENVGEAMFMGRIVMTSNFQNTFGDRVFYIVLESLAKIRTLILDGGETWSDMFASRPGFTLSGHL